MNSFADFLNLAPKLSKMPLPGEKVQLEMAAVERLQELQHSRLKEVKPKEAATMMLVYPKYDVPYFVLIERMISKGKHSGQIAFPGGRAEKEDPDYAHTALRETEEEIGIPINQQQLLTAGTPIYIPPSNYLVRPFISYATSNLSFVPQASEVKSIIEVPLKQLLDPTRVTSHRLSTSYMDDVNVPCFMLCDQIVWGATAMMLNEFKFMIQNTITSQYS